ncbi:hypothetical protein AAEX37_01978 [Oligella sp. MSHR50489EDL]|uniref:replication protein P n=1 Tax=Oligella sp. MSHR50489EDL TaxID=3139409 RepID=UPI003D818465
MNDKQMTIASWLSPLPGKDISPIMLLYKRLDGLYPSKWRSSFPDAEAIDNWREAWVEAFVEDNITPEMIKRGLENCRDMYDWPPSLTEFLKACKVPSKSEAREKSAQKPKQLGHEYIPCTPEEAAVHIAKIHELIKKNGPILKTVKEELKNAL